MIGQTSGFLEELLRPSDVANVSLGNVILAMTVAALLSLILAQVYRYTHRGTSYSQSFLITMFVMAVATSVVMMIIGSNLARAFSLVGALSIIRFRTAVKDVRDTAYLFAALIAGMGCGTGFYMPAVAMTAFVSVGLLVIHALDYGIKEKLDSVVRVTFRQDDTVLAEIEAALKRAFRDHRLINRILDYGDGQATNVYVVRPGRHTRVDEFESHLGKIDGVTNCSLYQSDQHAPF